MSDNWPNEALWLENLARTLDRRRFLRKSFQAGFALLAAAALGTTQIGKIFAAGACTCTFPYSRDCATIGSGQYHCPATTSGGCPSGCSVCTIYSGCDMCTHTSGHWSSCGCGSGGLGCVQCWDCRCPSSGACLYASCGCKSLCRCCNCLTPQDVVAEVQRMESVASPVP